MFYITGDTHNTIDVGKLSNRYFNPKNATKDDYLIVCGDFGMVWNNSKEDLYWQKWLNNKPYTVLFVDGNHENHNLLNEYPVEMWNGGKIHRIQNSVIHLMRGQVFTINGKKIFTMGGAESTDRWCRTENKSWWADEMPNDCEYNAALDNLEKNDYKVDYIITHCCPKNIKQLLINTMSCNKLENFFDSISVSTGFDRWFFGHYHTDESFGKYTCCYNKIIEIK